MRSGSRSAPAVVKTVKMLRFAQALEFVDGGFVQGVNATFWARRLEPNVEGYYSTSVLLSRAIATASS
jgi:hypothetical protein